MPIPTANLPAEVQTILCASRAFMDSPNRKQLQELLQQNLNWESLVRLAEAHGVLPLLYRNLADGFETSVPDAVFGKLSARFRASAQTSLVFVAELLRLLDLFQKQGIQTVPLRGPVMGAWLYGDLALRQPGDLDLLVRKSDVPPVKEILLSQGYHPFFPWPKDEKAVFSRGEYAFVRDPGNIMVDLHWKTSGMDFAIPNPMDFWDRLETVQVEGHAVSMLSWQDQLLLMSVHGTKHNWRRLIWLCDVAELMRKHEGAYWTDLLDQAKSIGISQMVTLALLLANACFQADIPEEFRKEADNNPAIEKRAQEFLGVLFREETEPRGILEDPLLFVRCMDRRRHQIRYLLQRTFTPTAWTVGDQAIPTRASFLQYLMRPLQMAKAYALPTVRKRYHGKSGKQ